MNKFTDVMDKRSDEELKLILTTNRFDYTPEALEAATEVAQQRGLEFHIKTEEEIQEETIQEQMYIHYDSNNRNYLDMTHYPILAVVRKELLWMSVCFAIVALGFNNKLADSSVYMNIISAIPIVALLLYTRLAIKKRKAKSIFLLKSSAINSMIWCAMVLFEVIIIFVSSLTGQIIVVIGLIYIIMTSFNLLQKIKESEIMTVFDKNFCSYSNWDKVLACVVGAIPVLMLLSFAVNMTLYFLNA